MRFATCVGILSSLALAQAMAFPDPALVERKGGDNSGSGSGGGGGSSGKGGGGGGGGCPAVWNTISSELTQSFVSGGQCTDLARGAIRFAFHDAGTFSLNLPFYPPAAGGADASLLLVPSEINRPENNGLQPYYAFLTGVYNKYKSQGVGAADLVYFAGNHAVVSCPGGPTVKTLVGRSDSPVDKPSPEGVMPPGFGPGSDAASLTALFAAKGFDAVDLAALVGAHSTSKAFGQSPNVPVGGAQDSTPGLWDVKFYGETYSPPNNVFRFQSDISLSQTNTTVGKEFQGFVNNQGKWNGKFADAFARMGLLGIPSSTSKNFIDCTNALPQSKGKRTYNNRAR